MTNLFRFVVLATKLILFRQHSSITSNKPKKFPTTDIPPPESISKALEVKMPPQFVTTTIKLHLNELDVYGPYWFGSEVLKESKLV